MPRFRRVSGRREWTRDYVLRFLLGNTISVPSFRQFQPDRIRIQKLLDSMSKKQIVFTHGTTTRTIWSPLRRVRIDAG